MTPVQTATTSSDNHNDSAIMESKLNGGSSDSKINHSSHGKSSSRKSTSLPTETVEYLKAWMMSPEHIAHPYPTEQEKAKIMKDTKIELKQLTNWFVNNRKRYWKPRVEARLQQQAQAQNAAAAAAVLQASRRAQQAVAFTGASNNSPYHHTVSAFNHHPHHLVLQPATSSTSSTASPSSSVTGSNATSILTLTNIHNSNNTHHQILPSPPAGPTAATIAMVPQIRFHNGAVLLQQQPTATSLQGQPTQQQQQQQQLSQDRFPRHASVVPDSPATDNTSSINITTSNALSNHSFLLSSNNNRQTSTSSTFHNTNITKNSNAPSVVYDDEQHQSESSVNTTTSSTSSNRSNSMSEDVLHMETVHRREVVHVHIVKPSMMTDLPTIKDVTILSNIPQDRILKSYSNCHISYTFPIHMSNDRKKIQRRRDAEVVRIKKHYLKVYLTERSQAMMMNSTPSPSVVSTTTINNNNTSSVATYSAEVSVGDSDDEDASSHHTSYSSPRPLVLQDHCRKRNIVEPDFEDDKQPPQEKSISQESQQKQKQKQQSPLEEQQPKEEEEEEDTQPPHAKRIKTLLDAASHTSSMDVGGTCHQKWRDACSQATSYSDGPSFEEAARMFGFTIY